MKVTFYYWGWQCPLHGPMRQLLERYGDRLEVSCVDITGRPDLAGEKRMLFPMLTEVDGIKRYFAPLRPAFLEALCRRELPEERPYRPQLGTRKVTGTIETLTRENLPLAAQCTGDPACPVCQEKATWLEGQGLSVLGCVNRQGDRLLGGAEFVPSRLAPYPIPKDPDTAFLTCLYGSAPEADYKSAPLRALEGLLCREYRRLIGISDEQGVFPNGDLELFLRNGYRDLGIIQEEPEYCRLHLVEKDLEGDCRVQTGDFPY